jgi:hypothetical protein
MTGKLTILRVNDVGTGYGPASDNIDAVFGLTLRNDESIDAQAIVKLDTAPDWIHT